MASQLLEKRLIPRTLRDLVLKMTGYFDYYTPERDPTFGNEGGPPRFDVHNRYQVLKKNVST